MAGKFIELSEAATQLGITPDELKELRDQGEIHGYRDGASWKFKPEEVERVAEERGITLGAAGESDSGSGLALDDDDLDNLISLDDSVSGIDLDEEEGSSSILISDDEEGGSDASSSSTIIGKDDLAVDPDSDIELGESESEISLADSGSAIVSADDDLKLEVDESAAGESDLHLSDDENLSGEFELSGDEFTLEDELQLENEEADLALSDDDDLLLGDSSLGEDDSLALDASDSGIGLTAPADSGLSLEADDLSGSDAALELPEDSDMISLESGELVDPEDATQLKQDEEFLLTPSDEMSMDESSDSGSQVIALEDSEAFDEDAATMVQGAAEPDFLEEADNLQPEMQAFEGAQTAGVAMVAMAPEAPYSIWNVIGLIFILVFLCLTGMLMIDVVRNMWSWDGDFKTTTSLMNALIDALGLSP